MRIGDHALQEPIGGTEPHVMPVTEDVRRAEEQIDASIRDLPIWSHSRPVVLNALLACYRDLIEVVFLKAAWAKELGRETDFVHVLADERDLNAGMLWSLKWAMVHAKDDGALTAPSDNQLLDLLVHTGPAYEILVDVLKLAKQDVVTIGADLARRILTIDQGGDRTGSDLSMLATQWTTDPFHHHTVLTADEDQLTHRWTAGDFRRAMRWLGERAAEGEDETIVSTLTGKPVPLIRRPSVITIPGELPDPAIARVVYDVTMDAQKVSGSRLWPLSSWMDMPIVQVGGDRRAVSSLLSALAERGVESHMLRIAARIDPNVYSIASTLRESRMIARCRSILEPRGWLVSDRVLHPGPPPKEIDVLAKRGAETLLLQLKSTLRPESVWEVYKRNEEVLAGIRHTAEVRARCSGAVGVVLTDGYRGDFATWSRALLDDVPIATLQELDDIAASPRDAVNRIAASRGVGNEPPGWAAPPNGEVSLVGWTIRLTRAV